jgi:protein prenyltransferase alpha subunit repeat containing protein 1
MIPEATELPPESQRYYPLVVVESKLGISKSNLAILLKEAHQYFITLSQDNHTELEHVTRVMIILKPDNYTAMNRRFVKFCMNFLSISSK